MSNQHRRMGALGLDLLAEQIPFWAPSDLWEEGLGRSGDSDLLPEKKARKGRMRECGNRSAHSLKLHEKEKR